MAERTETDKTCITIKKYANRRLYNTATSSYVTLEHLCQMVKNGVDFVVYDAKSGDDITRSVLTQIIVEEENKGQNLLPIGFLRQLISFYGDSMGGLVPRYLEFTMQSFARNQERMREMLQGTMGGLFPFAPLEEVGRQNMALFDRTMRMFSQGDAPRAEDDGGREDTRSIDELQQRIEAMQQQIDALSGKAPGNK